jgi:AcrR family transcriptional regulator
MPNRRAHEAGTRDRILRATIELIAEVGADRVRTRAVAERARVNPALVHYHFGSMSALIDAAVETVMAEESQPFIDALGHGPSVQVALESLFEGVQGIEEPTPGLMVSIDLLVRATRDPKTRSHVRRILREFRRLILDRLEEARRAGEIGTHVDLPAAAALLAALLDGLGMHRLIDRKVDARAAAEPLIAALFEPRSARDGRKGGHG